MLRIEIVTLPSQPSVAVGALNAHAAPHSTDLSAAQVSTGGVASTDVTVWLHVEALPQASVAFQVRVAVKLWPQPRFVTVLKIEIVTLPSQPSVALGGLNAHAAPHSTDLFAAQVSTGGVASTADTVWLHVAVLPQRSATTQVRMAVNDLPQRKLVTDAVD